MTEQKDDFFSSENEAQGSQYFKFEKIGDAVKGTYLGSSFKKSNDPAFPDQMVYELSTPECDVKVAFSIKKEFVINAMKRAKVGQIVGFRYDSDFETEASKAGKRKPAKTIKVYLGAMDPDYDMMKNMEEQGMLKVDEIPFN